KHKFSVLALLTSLAILTVFSCKRELEDLEPATFPTTAEVFIDGFSAGLNYGAFGGSKVTAFDVDTEVKYKGSAPMKFAVPDAGDPQGAYAGGSYFTSVGRNLSGYDALTFWARASKSASIDVVGLGNDFGESKFLATLRDVKVNTNWQKYIIPIPDPSKLTQERGMFFYSEGPEDGLGYTFWIDELKFEKLGTIAHPKAAIIEGQDLVRSVETGQTLSIEGLKVSFNLPTGVDQSVDAAPSYFTFSSSNPAVATVSSLGFVSVIDAGTAVITAKLGVLNAAGSLTLNSSGQAVGPTTPAPTPTVSADSVISLFSNAYTNVKVDTWNTRWQFSTAEDFDVQIAGNDVKRYRNLNFVGIEFSSQTINASAMTHFHLDLWTPDPTELPKAFKVLLVDFGANGTFGGGDDSSHELAFTRPTLVSNQWVSLDIPLSNFTGLVNRAHLAQLVLSGDVPNVYIDNVYFYNAGTVAPSGPTVAAPTPTRNPADVISIFSDAYTNVPGTDFNPNWGQATVVSQVQVAGNNTLRYGGLNYQGTQFASNLDVSAMTHLHLDFWTKNSTALNVYIISPGPVEKSFALTVPTNGWASVDIPLSSFSPVALNNLIQFKFDGNGDIYLDNLYFYKNGGGGTTPTTAAPTPAFNAADVISVFSDAYTNIAGTDLNPNWGQATQVTQVPVAGNNTLLYTGLNYQGIQLGSNQDLTGMAYLRLDFWTANSTELKVFLISPGPAEKPYTLTVPTSGWTSIDIPLTEFTPVVNLANVFQFKFEGNGNIYLDNILFHK
ncbi:MAG: Ig-like domain-containing protein, partial [Thermoanaerobaculia bacterium]|nr:Ig-like domain-containing protein [Thermoanaerobaculia bacterium]